MSIKYTQKEKFRKRERKMFFFFFGWKLIAWKKKERRENIKRQKALANTRFKLHETSLYTYLWLLVTNCGFQMAI
jgi:hypothetical protein